MTLNGVKAHICIISPNSVAIGANYVKVVENRPIYCLRVRQKCTLKNLVFNDISFMAIFVEVTENDGLSRGCCAIYSVSQGK